MNHITRFKSRLVNITLLLMLLVAGISTSHSIPAYPYPILHTLPDGSTITIQMRGDEYFGYTTTLAGYPVAKGEDGYFYYASYTAEDLVVSDVRASDVVTRGAIPVGMMDQATINSRRANSALRKYTTWLNAASGASLTKSSVSNSSSNNDLPSFYLTKPLVILVEYSDTKFTISSPVDSFSDLYNNDDPLPMASMRTYWSDNSMGQYVPTFEVHGVVTASKKSSYYAEKDENAAELVAEACMILDSEIDFSDYDQNGDGVVDNIIVLFAGYNQAEGGGSSTIWPHRWDVRAGYKSVTLDGVTLGGYAILSEFKGSSGAQQAGIGTTVHEFGHVLGLMDVYDTDYEENGSAVGIGSNSLMGSGNYNNSGNTPPYLNMMERVTLGWASYTPIPDDGDITLEPLGESNMGYVIETGNANEYYLMEARDSKLDWDQYIDNSNMTTAGLMIYHVDKSENYFGGMTAAEHWVYNDPNAYADHECMRLIASTATVDFTDMESYVYPGNNFNTSLTGESSPALVSWAGENLSVEVLNIIWEDDMAKFSIGGENYYKNYSVEGSIVDSDNQPISGAVVKLVTSTSTSDQSQVSSGVGSLSLVSLSPDLTKASNEYSTETNSQGAYSFATVTTGSYDVMVSAYGYAPYTTTIEVDQNMSLDAITLDASESSLQTRISHASTLCTGYLYGATTGLEVMWSSDMLEEQGLLDVPINNIYWISGVEGVSASAKVYVDGVAEFSTQFTTKSGYNIIPITSLLTVGEGQTLEIEYTYSQTNGYIVATDSGPAVAGYGDLVSVGNGYSSLSSTYGIDVNIACGFTVDKSDTGLDTADIVLTALGQYYFRMIWDSDDMGIEKWIVGIQGGDYSETIETTELEYMMSEAQPGTTYTISITPSYAGVEGTAYTSKFTTPSLTAPYSAMSLILVSSGTYYVTYTNTSEMPTAVNVTLNGSSAALESDGQSAYLTLSEGENTIVLTLTYTDGTSETITRKITV